MKKDPEYYQIEFGKIHPWKQNPRDIKKEDLQILAESIKEKRLFRNLVCWRENGRIVTGGGNMRWNAMKHVLKFPDDRKIWISENFPETEQEKIELSLMDNMIFGSYLEQPLAEMLYPYRSKIKLKNFKFSFSNPIDLKSFVDGFGPSDVEDIEFIDKSDRRTISIVCHSDEELIEMREFLGISDKKSNAIDATILRELVDKKSKTG